MMVMYLCKNTLNYQGMSSVTTWAFKKGEKADRKAERRKDERTVIQSTRGN